MKFENQLTLDKMEIIQTMYKYSYKSMQLHHDKNTHKNTSTKICVSDLEQQND